MIFIYPRLSRVDLGLVRVLGPGLGNLLFPWARSVVLAHRTGYPLLYPTWPQIKIGSVLRRERDTRFYSDLFRCPPRGYVSGAARLALLACGVRVPESALESASQVRGRPRLAVVEGMAGLFEPLVGHHELVRTELIRMTHECHLRGATHANAGGVSIHVRLGDFLPASTEALRTGNYNYRIPLSWYVARAQELQQRLGVSRFHVFSDGSDAELADLLALPGAQRVDFGSSIADLIALAHSRVLIASGSTFSMWASYLGSMPTLWYPGQLRQRLHADTRFELEVDDATSVTDAAWEVLRDALSNFSAAE